MGFVYQIRNKINNHVYIGSTVNLKHRRKIHLSSLENGKHHCIFLQRAYDKYGKDNFVFEIIDELDDYRKKEEILINEKTNLYNVSKRVSGGDLISYHPNKNFIIEKRTKTQKNKLKNLTNEQKQEKWGKKGKENPNWKGGIHLKKKFCKCGNNKSTTAKTCIKCRKTTGKNNPFYGKTHNEKTKNKISKINKGRVNLKDRKKVCSNGFVYDSLSEAAIKNNITIAAMCYRVYSKNFPEVYYI